MTRTEKLKEAYEILKEGEIIEFINETDKTGNVRCWIGKSSNPHCRKRYIFWRCHGQSANDMSLSSLRWIAKTIGNCNAYNYRIVDSVYGN